MVINLNKKLVTKALLLEKINEIDIYSYYIDDTIDLSTTISSPLREKDDNPSFGFFVNSNKEILFKDFVLGGGDCIKFVQMMFNLNFNEALSKIVIDLELTNDFHYKNINLKTTNTKNIYKSKEDLLKNINFENKLQIRKREWLLHDLKYWRSYNIDIELLEKYNVCPIDYIFINDNPIKTDTHAYCFIEYKDGVETYKIYQPYNNKFKWLNNHNDSVWQGWTQLPDKGERVIITKSLKDVMSIVNTLNIPAISLQAESVKPKDAIISELKSRFKEVFIFYDNDFDKETNWGREFGKKLSDAYDIMQYEIPDYYQTKDFSDLIKNVGVDHSKKIWNMHIDIPF
jgi:hypothetical protein